MKKPAAFLSILLFSFFMMTGFEKMDKSTAIIEATYLGVENYGAEETNKDNKDDFTYRFEINGEEQTFKVDNGTQDDEGDYDYINQNILKEGYTYTIIVEDGTVVTAVEKETEKEPFTPVVQGTPGEKTLANFLKTSLEPVGTTLYIYGGGWDWQDVGSSPQARSLGVSSDWVTFFDSQDENYTYKEKNGDEALADPASSYYPYGEYNEYYYAGLDCSGFAGWALYNTMETEDLKEGYVGGATGCAKRLGEKGWGTWTQDIQAPDGQNGYEMKPGDIMSINGHVWISLGTCEDGSVVIVHSTPSKSRTGQPGGGVQISAVGTSENCQAYALADQYMSKYYVGWYERYPAYLCDPEVYFTFTGDKAGRFSWDISGAGALTDPDGLQKMQPEEVLDFLMAGCGPEESEPVQTKDESAAETSKQIQYRFADKEAGWKLMSSNIEFFDGFTENDLQFRLQKKDASLGEYLLFARDQVLDFSEEQKALIGQYMDRIEKILTDNGYQLPPLDRITFICTTMKEECDMTAYTHGTQIYLSESFLNSHIGKNEYEPVVSYVLAHEVFHCLTRCNPDFRADLYKLIHFTVQEKEYELPPSVREYYISNPDVEHHNAYAAFEIGGAPIDCYLAFITKAHFEKEGDRFMDAGTAVLVPADGTDTYYYPEDASNFNEVLGENTNYTIDPEECMATNFGYLIAYDQNGPEGNGYKTPEIIDGIREYLQKETPGVR